MMRRPLGRMSDLFIVAYGGFSSLAKWVIVYWIKKDLFVQ